MGRSYTVHCIGIEGGLAMNRAEIAQEVHKAAKRGIVIHSWYTQTKTGERILGGRSVATSDIPLPKMVTCPICEGAGHNGRAFCPICNGSGICRPGNESH